MRDFRTIAALALVMGCGSVEAAPLVTLSALGETSTSRAGVTIVDFNDGCGYASCIGEFQIVLGSSAGFHAQPAGTNTPYLSVPNPSASGTAILSLGTIANYFGLYWGSIDSFNSIAFSNGGDIIASYSGTDLVGEFANGNQVDYTSNRYVNFDFGGEVFDTILLSSNGYAFETDNHAYGFTGPLLRTSDVPEPTAQILLLAGIAGLFGLRKRLFKLTNG